MRTLSTWQALARQRPAAMTEAEWQRGVQQFASEHGWRHYHTFDSRRSEAGFPDLTLVRAGRLIFAELKSERHDTTPAQREWLRDLGDCLGVQVFVWRPSDIREVEQVLG